MVGAARGRAEQLPPRQAIHRHNGPSVAYSRPHPSKPTTTGWGPERITSAWTVLMKRLGYSKFVAQGGDWGAVITDLMGVQAPPELLGIHTNMPGAVSADTYRAVLSGAPMPRTTSHSVCSSATVPPTG